MKSVLLTTLLFVLVVNPSFSISKYSNGEELSVWAISGLNLRSEPNAKSTKVLNIPYGEKVKVIDTNLFTSPFQFSMVKSKYEGGSTSWSINGFWVEIDYNGQRGFVFDGYLGRLPVITNTPEDAPFFNLEVIKRYGGNNFGGLDEEITETIKNFDDNSVDPDKGMSSSHKITFKNGSYYESVDESFSGYTTIFIKDISLEEGFLIFNALTGFEYKKKLNGESQRLGDGIHLTAQKEDELYFTSFGMSSILIKKVKGGVSIQSGGGC